MKQKEKPIKFKIVFLSLFFTHCLMSAAWAVDHSTVFHGAVESIYSGLKKAHQLTQEDSVDEGDLQKAIAKYSLGIRYFDHLNNQDDIDYEVKKALNMLEDIAGLVKNKNYSNKIADALEILNKKSQFMNCIIDTNNSPETIVIDLLYEMADFSCKPVHQSHVFVRVAQAEKKFVLGAIKEVSFMMVDISMTVRGFLGMQTSNVQYSSGQSYSYASNSGLFQNIEKHVEQSHGNIVNFTTGFISEEAKSMVDQTLGKMIRDDVVDQVMGIQTLGLILLGSKIKTVKIPSVKLPKLKLDITPSQQLAISLAFDTVGGGSIVMLGPESVFGPLIMRANELNNNDAPRRRIVIGSNNNQRRRPDFNEQQAPENILPEELYQEPRNPRQTPEVSNGSNGQGRTRVSNGDNEVLVVSYETSTIKRNMRMPDNLNELDLPEDAVVIDVGAGMSNLTKEFRESGYDNAYAVSPEYSLHSRDIANLSDDLIPDELTRRTEHGDAGMYRNDFDTYMNQNRDWSVPGWADDLPIRTGTVDFIVCHKLFNNISAYSLHTFKQNMMPKIADMYRTLKPGGSMRVDGLPSLQVNTTPDLIRAGYNDIRRRLSNNNGPTELQTIIYMELEKLGYRAPDFIDHYSLIDGSVYLEIRKPE